MIDAFFIRIYMEKLITAIYLVFGSRGSMHAPPFLLKKYALKFTALALQENLAWKGHVAH